MFRKDLDASLFVISHKRPQNRERIEAVVGPATWVVGAGEAEAYGPDSVEGGRLTASRNAALKLAFEQGHRCIQISDDIKSLSLVKFFTDGKKLQEKISFAEAIALMTERLEMSPFHLAGVSPTANPFYSNRSISNRHFVIGDMILVRPCELIFDETMTLKEDYDYTLQHIQRFGGVIRNDDILAKFEHYTNSGGAVSIRNTDEEQKNIRRLKEKWGNVVRDNPRRPNEILLRF